MKGPGPTAGKATANRLRTLANHRKLVDTVFPRSISATRRDAAASVAVEDEESMFHSAASQGMLSSVRELLANEALTYDLPDRFGRTPLHWAAEQGHRNVVLALLRAGASVDPRSQRKDTPIMLAASGGHEKLVRVLLRYRGGESDRWPFNHRDRGIGHWRTTALHCAAAGGHVRVVEALLDAGFDKRQHDGAGLTPAEVSARQSHYTSAAITHLLLSSNDMGGRLVHDYVDMAMQDVATVSGLVKGGAFLDWQDGNGETPLHRAVHFHHATISRILLQAGADPNLRDHNGASPLHVAATTGCVETVSDLLEAGADVTSLAVGGFSPLHRAVVTNRADVVSLLLNAGASMEHRDTTHGQTPLSWACEGCLAPIVRVLVKAGADVESRSSAGLVPLHWACRFIDSESVEVLLNAGANPGAVDQAAAHGAATPLSAGVMISSIPVAIDVVGLGYPLDGTEDSRRTSVTMAARRLDLDSVWRIQVALRGAQRERSWRRRCWLVMLASRRASGLKCGVRGERWAVDHNGCSPGRSRGVAIIVERPPCTRQKDDARYRADTNTNSDSPVAQHPRPQWHDEPSKGNKRPKSVDNAMMVANGMPFRQGLLHGDIRAQATVDAFLSKVVGDLFGLAAVEVGLFRSIVLFM